jgi:hypothetical protein
MQTLATHEQLPTKSNMKRKNKSKEEEYEETYEAIAELLAEEINMNMRALVAKICADPRILALEWGGTIEKGYTPRVARLAIEKALEDVMDSELTFALIPENCWKKL